MKGVDNSPVLHMGVKRALSREGTGSLTHLLGRGCAWSLGRHKGPLKIATGLLP